MYKIKATPHNLELLLNTGRACNMNVEPHQYGSLYYYSRQLSFFYVCDGCLLYPADEDEGVSSVHVDDATDAPAGSRCIICNCKDEEDEDEDE